MKVGEIWIRNNTVDSNKMVVMYIKSKLPYDKNIKDDTWICEEYHSDDNGRCASFHYQTGIIVKLGCKIYGGEDVY